MVYLLVILNMYIMTTRNTNTIFASVTQQIAGEEEIIIPSSFSGGKQENRHYPFTVAICIIIKDAEHYLEEWLYYHFAMGFDSIYIYDNSNAFELKNWYDNTRNHTTFRNTKVIHWVSPDKGSNQNLSYKDCVEKFGHEKNGPMHDYFAFIDVDEFVVIRSPQQYNGIHDVLQDYLVPYGGALTVNWMLVGSANKTVYSPLPVTKRFQYRDRVAHNVIKSFVKSSDYVRHKTPHSVILKSPAEIHTTMSPGAIFKPASEAAASDHDRPSDILLLYHYRYTSRKEYIYKRCFRGEVEGDSWCDDNGNGNSDISGINYKKGTPKHVEIAAGEVFDDTAWKFLRERVPKYKAFDAFEDFHYT